MYRYPNAARRGAQDPEMMREAQKMMQSPEFQAYMKQMTQSQAFQQSMKKTQEVMKDPKKMKEMESKVNQALEEGTKQLEKVKLEDKDKEGEEGDDKKEAAKEEGDDKKEVEDVPDIAGDEDDSKPSTLSDVNVALN
eukprot:CAMPEP_0113570102 /NCGR_PEP_ID=MMETSP0015_2-20120614/24779_1 /TAXON_ID=2838 /ORGANISM="Odontella" /LENGTH=136 /DNA_ID=CAMNT_0000472839 /DNA_START=401 /DNA_END=811 /DNA_ORIENTATION=- /assembly_acc=CAM_ASM_000160